MKKLKWVFLSAVLTMAASISALGNAQTTIYNPRNPNEEIQPVDRVSEKSEKTQSNRENELPAQQPKAKVVSKDQATKKKTNKSVETKPASKGLYLSEEFFQKSVKGSFDYPEELSGDKPDTEKTELTLIVSALVGKVIYGTQGIRGE